MQDDVQRCEWGTGSDIYEQYHDREWGRPTTDNNLLFEKICLEGFQSGLSWITILKKRENFRDAFSNFDIASVARFTQADVDRLLTDKGIVRHQGKIKSVINNAARAIELTQECGSLRNFFWSYLKAGVHRAPSFEELRSRSQSEESVAMAKALKKRGWSFVGPTTCYAFMQSEGIVNDHQPDCAFREEVEEQRQAVITEMDGPKRTF